MRRAWEAPTTFNLISHHTSAKSLGRTRFPTSLLALWLINSGCDLNHDGRALKCFSSTQQKRTLLKIDDCTVQTPIHFPGGRLRIRYSVNSGCWLRVSTGESAREMSRGPQSRPV